MNSKGYSDNKKSIDKDNDEIINQDEFSDQSSILISYDNDLYENDQSIEDQYDDNLSLESSLSTNSPYSLKFHSEPYHSLINIEDAFCCIAIHPKFPEPAHFAIGSCDDKCRIFSYSFNHADHFNLYSTSSQYESNLNSVISDINKNNDNSTLKTINNFNTKDTTQSTTLSSSLFDSNSSELNISTKSYFFKTIILLDTLDIFKDTVSSIAYSSCGIYLACGCYDSTIYIFKCNSSEKHFSEKDLNNSINYQYTHLYKLEGPNGDIEWLQWHPRGPAILSGAKDATSWLWWVPSQKIMRVFTGQSKSITHGSFGHDANSIITASEDGTCFIYSHTGTKLHEFGTRNTFFSDHNEDDNDSSKKEDHLITSLAVHTTRPLISIGYMDGHIKLIHSENGKIISHFNGHNKSIESLLFFKSEQGYYFGPNDTLISGGLDGNLIFWDISKLIMRGKIDIAPFLLPYLILDTSLNVQSSENPYDFIGIIKIFYLSLPLPYLVLTTTTGQICVIDFQNLACKYTFNAHDGPILDACSLNLAHKVTHIISVGEDGASFVWEINLDDLKFPL